MDDLTITHREDGNIDVLTLAGDIDVYTAPRLREALTNRISAERHLVVVDMTAVDFFDSTGLGILVGGLKRARAHDGQVDLVVTTERLRKVFRMTGLSRVFAIHDTADAAVAALRQVSHA